MTINQLHKELTKLIEAGHKRKPVTIDKRTFNHPEEDNGVVIMDVKKLEVSNIEVADDDGWIKENKDGSSSSRIVLILRGK
tara:strand:- start:9 stop:251 length:243 start_codon:yes stop_codon:yes gene_type:complete